MKKPDLPKYICAYCGYVYDPAPGEPIDGIKPGTDFQKIPAGWLCPHCMAPKKIFKKK